MRWSATSLRQRWTATLTLVCATGMLLAAGGAAWGVYWELAKSQDQRLSAAVRHLPPLSPQQVWWPGTGSWQPRAHDVTPATVPGEPRAAVPTFTIGHVDGELARIAMLSRPGDGSLVQAAEPLRARWPGWAAISTPFAWFLAGLGWAAIGALAATGLAWGPVRRALAGLQEPQSEHGPLPPELAPAFEALYAARHAQAAAADQQTRFMADAAHQLRTPMAALRAQIQTLRGGQGSSELILTEMLQSIDRTVAVTNQLLDVHRLDQLRRTAGFVPVSLKSAVTEALNEVVPLLAPKRLDFDFEGEDFHIGGDETMLVEVLRNLLANAVHHSPARARIGVRLRQQPDSREAIVWDEGPGIADAMRPRLFTPYASNAGVGLGLSICQQLASAMGASVRLFDRVDDGRRVGVDAVIRWPRA